MHCRECLGYISTIYIYINIFNLILRENTLQDGSLFKCVKTCFMNQHLIFLGEHNMFS